MQRRREIGIRIAMGARRADVLRLVMKEGLALVTVGSFIGLVLARAAIRAMGAIVADLARVTGASESDPVLLIGAPAVRAIVALVACYVPARASTRVDPVEALRAE
jgi:putative ABC transport system permease protein